MLPPFAEKVMCLKAGEPWSRLEDRWMGGLFLGVQDNSDEVETGTRDGVIKARRVCRGSTLSWSERCVGRHGMRSREIQKKL